MDVAASTFALTTRHDRTVTVSAAKATIVKTVSATVADAGAGSFVVAKGDTAADGGTLNARRLSILEPAGKRHGYAGDHVVAGTVVSSDGSTLGVDVNRDGAVDRNVATSADTRATRTCKASAADLAAGDRATAYGKRSGPRAFTARLVRASAVAAPAPAPVAPALEVERTAAAAPEAKPEPEPTKVLGETQTRDEHEDDGHREWTGTFGTVASVSGNTFVVDGRTGPVTVTTSEATTFVKWADGRLVKASVADLAAGVPVKVLGLRSDDGSIAATSVAIGPWTRDGFGRHHDGERDGFRTRDGSRDRDGSWDGDRDRRG